MNAEQYCPPPDQSIPGEKLEKAVADFEKNRGELQGAKFTTLIDGSHKYTDVFSDDYVGPGSAHHNYLIKRKDGNPFVFIRFQNGPIKEAGVNGVMDENLLAIVIDRLRGFQSGAYKCAENQEALEFIEAGLKALQDRTKAREARGVEGTHTV